MDSATEPFSRGSHSESSPVPPRIGSSEDPDRWVEQYGDALYREAFARVGDRAAAEDLVQETLLSAWKGLEGFDRRSSFRTWLYAILKRRVADHFRKKSRDQAESDCRNLSEFDRTGSWARTPSAWRGGAVRTALDAATNRSSPQQTAEHAEFWEVVRRCAGDLPVHLARAIKSRTFMEKSTGEVCEQEGITAKNLSVRMHRARLLLRRCLEQKWFCDDR